MQLPPEMAMYAWAWGPWPEVGAAVTRYCLACECSQKSIAGEPCWQCGGTELTTTKPSWWPYNQGETQYASRIPDEAKEVAA